MRVWKFFHPSTRFYPAKNAKKCGAKRNKGASLAIYLMWTKVNKRFPFFNFFNSSISSSCTKKIVRGVPLRKSSVEHLPYPPLQEQKSRRISTENPSCRASCFQRSSHLAISGTKAMPTSSQHGYRRHPSNVATSLGSSIF